MDCHTKEIHCKKATSGKTTFLVYVMILKYPLIFIQFYLIATVPEGCFMLRRYFKIIYVVGRMPLPLYGIKYLRSYKISAGADIASSNRRR